MTQSDLKHAERELRLLKADMAAALAIGDARDAALSQAAVLKQEEMVRRWREDLSRSRRPGERCCPAEMESESED